MGTPFHSTSSTPSTKWLSVTSSGMTLETMNRGAVSGPNCSTRNGSRAAVPARGDWRDVRGVGVAQVGEDAADLAVERVVRHQARPLVKATQLLHRVDAVHRPLQRKVHVQAVEQLGEHRDDVGALDLSQRIARWRGGDCLRPTEPDQCLVHGRTAPFAKSWSRLSSRCSW